MVGSGSRDECGPVPETQLSRFAKRSEEGAELLEGTVCRCQEIEPIDAGLDKSMAQCESRTIRT